jgi:adenylate cyclase
MDVVEIRFPKLGRSVCVESGALLIDAVRSAKLPIASGCGADGLCGRCGVAVSSGADALAVETPEETRCKQRNRIDPALRLACRTRVTADLSVTAPYW